MSPRRASQTAKDAWAALANTKPLTYALASSVRITESASRVSGPLRGIMIGMQDRLNPARGVKCSPAQRFGTSAVAARASFSRFAAQISDVSSGNKKATCSDRIGV